MELSGRHALLSSLEVPSSVDQPLVESSSREVLWSLGPVLVSLSACTLRLGIAPIKMALAHKSSEYGSSSHHIAADSLIIALLKSPALSVCCMLNGIASMDVGSRLVLPTTTLAMQILSTVLQNTGIRGRKLICEVPWYRTLVPPCTPPQVRHLVQIIFF